MSWFDDVAHGGTTEWERQSWRDNFNKGVAAGDFTGGTNARLDAERAAFGGATWTGSSTHLSALDLARLRGQSAAPSVLLADGLAGRLGSEPPSAAVGRGATRGAAVVQAFGPNGLIRSQKATDMVMAGRDFKANPHWDDAEEIEKRWGDVGSALYSPVIMAVDFGHNAARMYFGESYQSIPTSERLKIVGARSEQALTDTVHGARHNVLSSFFGGVDAIQSWGRDNKAVEHAAKREAKQFDDAWDYRMELQYANSYVEPAEVLNPPPVHWTEERLPAGKWGY